MNTYIQKFEEEGEGARAAFVYLKVENLDFQVVQIVTMKTWQKNKGFSTSFSGS